MQGSQQSVEAAIIRRIMARHLDLLTEYGPQKILEIVQDRAQDLDDLEEIGSSDVSGWVQDVIHRLKA